MRRREFIALLGSAAAAWPLAAPAQQTERMRRIGVVVAYAESDPEAQTRVIAFRQTLEGLGWIEGRNVAMEYRWGAGDADRARAFATELVSLKPDIILAHGTPAVTAVYTENLIRIDGGGNRLTSAHNDRAVVFYPGRRGLAVKVEEPA